MRRFFLISSCLLHLLQILLLWTSFSHPTSATRAGLPYIPLNLPNLLLQPERRRPIQGVQPVGSVRSILRRARQIIYMPTCEGTLLREGDDPWPPGHPLEDYIETQSLCAARDFGGFVYPDGHSANMGGSCYQNLKAQGHGPPAMIPWFDFDEDEANPLFYDIVPFRHRCYEWCHCERLKHGMTYAMVRINHERYRPLGDIELNSVPGLEGGHADKEADPILMSDLQVGKYKKYSRNGNMEKADVGIAVLQVPDTLRPQCAQLESSKGVYFWGLVNSVTATCPGWEASHGKRGLGTMEKEEQVEQVADR
jgi:hypothetical protein